MRDQRRRGRSPAARGATSRRRCRARCRSTATAIAVRHAEDPGVPGPQHLRGRRDDALGHPVQLDARNATAPASSRRQHQEPGRRAPPLQQRGQRLLLQAELLRRLAGRLGEEVVGVVLRDLARHVARDDAVVGEELRDALDRLQRQRRRRAAWCGSTRPPRSPAGRPSRRRSSPSGRCPCARARARRRRRRPASAPRRGSCP